MTIYETIASPGCGCDRQVMLHSRISVDEALARIAVHAAPVGRTEAVALDSAVGRILAQLVRSRFMAPAFDNARRGEEVELRHLKLLLDQAVARADISIRTSCMCRAAAA